jgi:hypothetical protein
MTWSITPTLRLVWTLALGSALAACGGATDINEFPPLANAVVTGTVAGALNVPLDSVHIGLTVPPALAAQYSFGSADVLTDAQGRFTFPIAMLSAPAPAALPDTLRIAITSTALPPRYTPPPGEQRVRDSALADVAFAPRPESAPITEIRIVLPVAPPDQ